MLRGGKARFLRRNRRLLQEKQASFSLGRSPTPSRLFTAADLEKATGSYHPAHLIKGDGPYEIYRGTVGAQSVSVKRASPRVVAGCGVGRGDDHVVEGLITEIVVLSGIGHRNVVKLLGCCLETQVPILVYELHSHGTLQDHAVAAPSTSGEPMSWSSRLRVAVEVAGGLHYLHRHAPMTIVHSDVKPWTIILDEQSVPKITDFALSVAIPPGQTHAKHRVVAGTSCYTDPDWFFTSMVTEKSDVYSFGMLLVVLMLGKHPHEWEDEGGRPFIFRLGSGDREMGGGSVLREELVASACGLREAEGKMEQIGAFAHLALECLRCKGLERPTMKEVERRLREIRSFTP